MNRDKRRVQAAVDAVFSALSQLKDAGVLLYSLDPLGVSEAGDKRTFEVFEFYGDAVMYERISAFLMASKRFMDPHILTQLRQCITRNDTLVEVFNMLHLERLCCGGSRLVGGRKRGRALSDTASSRVSRGLGAGRRSKHQDKVLADVVESIIGEAAEAAVVTSGGSTAEARAADTALNLLLALIQTVGEERFYAKGQFRVDGSRSSGCGGPVSAEEDDESGRSRATRSKTKVVAAAKKKKKKKKEEEKKKEKKDKGTESTDEGPMRTRRRRGRGKGGSVVRRAASERKPKRPSRAVTFALPDLPMVADETTAAVVVETVESTTTELVVVVMEADEAVPAGASAHHGKKRRTNKVRRRRGKASRRRGGSTPLPPPSPRPVVVRAEAAGGVSLPHHFIPTRALLGARVTV